MKWNKLAAFTITELLVVMVISSILLTSATLLYTNVSRYQLRLAKRIDNVNAVNRVKYLLAKDLKNHSDFEMVDGLLTSTKGQLAYQFKSDTIIRYYGEFEEVFSTGANLENVDQRLILTFSLYDQVIVVPFEQKKAYRDTWEANQGNTEGK